MSSVPLVVATMPWLESSCAIILWQKRLRRPAQLQIYLSEKGWRNCSERSAFCNEGGGQRKRWSGSGIRRPLLWHVM